MSADIRDEESVVAMVREAEAAWGQIDVLVNNAGICLVKMLDETTLAEWQNVFAVNVQGAFLMTKAVLPLMLRRNQGAIVNISSIWGMAGAACEVAYSASKAALIAMTQGLARELGPSGIRVNCIAPGVIATAMNEGFSAAELSDLSARTALGHLGTPEDVAAAVLFLASESAAYITGQTLGVTGGFL
jgi:3-oxoacyl-[acyl-carrier protein] reductase